MVLTHQIFRGGHFTGTSQGQTYKRRRDPEIIAGVENGTADVGFVGSDKIKEWRPLVEVRWVGEVSECDFVLATRIGNVAIVESRLERGDRLSVVTSNVNWLDEFATKNNWILDTTYVSGGAESYRDEKDMIADLRVKGNSIRDNGLKEFKVLERVKLGLIYGACAERKVRSTPINMMGYLASLRTIESRALGIRAEKLQETYSEELLADQNKQVKKLASETGELIREMCRPDFDADRFTGEVADLFFAAEVACAAKGISVNAVLNELARRNC